MKTSLTDGVARRGAHGATPGGRVGLMPARMESPRERKYDAGGLQV